MRIVALKGIKALNYEVYLPGENFHLFDKDFQNNIVKQRDNFCTNCI